MKKALLLVVTATFFSVVNAQDQYLVYSVKGNVLVSENKTSSKALVGKMMDDAATVTVPANGGITMICNQLNLVTINKPGTFKLANFKEQCRDATPASMSGNYIKYVWNQLTQKPGSPEKNRKMFMNNVGAVSRGINNIWIDSRLDTIYYVDGNFPLSWKSYAEAADFEFMLFDQMNSGQPAHTVATKNKYVYLKELASQLKPGNTYYWTAAVKGENNEEKKVLIIPEKSAFQQLLNAWNAENLGVENDAGKSFRLAFLLEQAHYLPAAYEAYKKAATLQPEVTMYQSTLDSFKKDYNIN